MQWVALHMQGASFPLHPLPPCPNPNLSPFFLLTPRIHAIIAYNIGFGQGGSGCSGKLAPCMCRETHCTCASSPCIFFFVFHPQMIQILDIKSNNFQKNVEFLEFFGFTLCFRTFQAKKKFKIFFTRLIKNFRINLPNFLADT